MERPRLKWQRTWTDGDPDDYTVNDPDHPMLHARIYRLSVPAEVGDEVLGGRRADLPRHRHSPDRARGGARGRGGMVRASGHHVAVTLPMR